jgi:hypothetical protein
MMDADVLRVSYNARVDRVLKMLGERLQAYLIDLLRDQTRIDAVRVRPKSVDRFMQKAAKLKDDGTPKYSEPLSQFKTKSALASSCFTLATSRESAPRSCGGTSDRLKIEP